MRPPCRPIRQDLDPDAYPHRGLQRIRLLLDSEKAGELAPAAELRPVRQCAEGSDSAVRARVTDSAVLAGSRWSRIFGIRGSELRHGENRLSMFTARLNSRFDIASILAFVESGHPLEPVLREELPAPEHGGGRRLNPQPQMDHRVDIRMRTNEIEHLRNRVPGLATGEVDRITAAPSRRHSLINRRLDLFGQLDQFESNVRTRIRREHAPPADRRKDHHATSVRQRLRRQSRAPFEGFLNRRRTQYPDLSTHSVEDAVVTCQSARMTRGSALSFRARPAFHEHQRLSRGQSRSRTAKSAAIANTFDVGHGDSGIRIDSEVLEKIGHAGLSRVA